MRFLNLRSGIVPFLILIMLIQPACKKPVKKLKSPPHYNFSLPVGYKLDIKLKEISGLVWDPGGYHFLAINDEKGTLFFLDKNITLPPTEFSFGGKGDYEDVALKDGVPYVLRSDGTITKILKTENGKYHAQEVSNFNLKGTNDFETMYYDPGRNALIVICKNCEMDDKNMVSAFAVYPDSTGFDGKPIFQINAAKIKEMSPQKTSRFQPSAAAIHPILQKLFVISSASNQLAITDLSGNVEAVFHLSKKLFRQAEGIAFEQDGDMYISNEGVSGPGTILKFDYVDNTQTKQQVSAIGYDFNSPDETLELGQKLTEISGMGYMPEKNLIIAQNDEKGELFTIDFKNKSKEYGRIRFSGKSDYEDIVYTDSANYLLISTGAVLKVTIKDSVIVPKEHTLGIEGKNEFETLYRDTDGSLVLLCKECDHEKDTIRAAYRFDPRTNSFTTKPIYRIDIRQIQKILNNDHAEFKPSAAGVHPVTGKIFVVASVGKLLVVLSKDGRVEEVIKLDPLLYPQPEGLTFAPNGDLYISNEGAGGTAKIYKFNYKIK